MNNLRCSLAAILSFALSGSLLASCGGSSPEPPAPTVAASPTEAAASPDASPEATAAAPATSPASAPATANAPLAEQNYCLNGEVLFHVMETQGFWVNICGGARPSHYVGVSKSDGKNIRLPLNDYSPEGLWYEAYNGSTRYQVALHGEEAPVALVVTDTAKGDRVLVQQDVLRDQQLASASPGGGSAEAPNHNYCESNESMFVAAETENFWLNICGGDWPHHYVGVSKKDSARIRLALSDYDSQGDRFVANNGSIRYELFLVGDPEALVVTDTSNGKVLVREPIVRF